MRRNAKSDNFRETSLEKKRRRGWWGRALQGLDVWRKPQDGGERLRAGEGLDKFKLLDTTCGNQSNETDSFPDATTLVVSWTLQSAGVGLREEVLSVLVVLALPEPAVAARAQHLGGLARVAQVAAVHPADAHVPQAAEALVGGLAVLLVLLRVFGAVLGVLGRAVQIHLRLQSRHLLAIPTVCRGGRG